MGVETEVNAKLSPTELKLELGLSLAKRGLQKSEMLQSGIMQALYTTQAWNIFYAF